MSKLIYYFQCKFKRFLLKFKTKFIYKGIFKSFGENSLIDKPLMLLNPENIIIGNNVNILRNAWLSAVPIIQGDDCILEIKDGCSIGNFSHIYSTKKVIIEKKVLIADKVYISDNLHSYSDISIPIIDQQLHQINSVQIGEGTWIGENVCIIGVKIGKNCVIGANSVVTNDIPDYSIAAGVPARVLKRYNPKNKKWEKIQNKS